jgi:hypothetical protein
LEDRCDRHKRAACDDACITPVFLASAESLGSGLVALYGCMYYGMLRPSEAVSLMLDECKLPEQGWGLLEFSEVRSAAGREWTDDGEVHDVRGPKGGRAMRSAGCRSRPSWSQMIREHVEQFGTAPDGRLFRTYRGSIYLPSTLWQVLQKARPPGLHRGPGRLSAGPQTLRLPPCGHLVASQRGDASAVGSRVGGAHC